MSYSVFTLIGRIRTALAEMSYAQTRLLEIRTGHLFTAETERRIARAEIRRLQRIYDLEHQDPRSLPPTPLSYAAMRRPPRQM